MSDYNEMSLKEIEKAIEKWETALEDSKSNENEIYKTAVTRLANKALSELRLARAEKIGKK